MPNSLNVLGTKQKKKEEKEKAKSKGLKQDKQQLFVDLLFNYP